MSSSWYGDQLQLPSWVPSKVFFPFIWAFIYITYIVTWIKLQSNVDDKRFSLDSWTLDISFMISLVLNMLWSYTFFGVRTKESIRLSIVLLIMNLFIVVYQLQIAYRVGDNILCGFLSVYVAWICIACMMNVSVELR